MESIQQVFFGSQTSGSSNSFYTAKSAKQFVDITLSVSAADAIASYTIESSAEPFNSWAQDTTAVTISTLPPGITRTGGVVSVASPAIGSYRLRFALDSGPYVRVTYAYTSGAVISTRVVISAHD